jgi:hypothetical protein
MVVTTTTTTTTTVMIVMMMMMIMVVVVVVVVVVMIVMKLMHAMECNNISRPEHSADPGQKMEMKPVPSCFSLFICVSFFCFPILFTVIKIT